MSTIALLLLQMSLFQTWVDMATRELGIKPITVIESSRLSGYAAANDSTIFIHPLLITRGAPSLVLRHLAYHEVCHVYLKHYGRNLTKRQGQDEANECAMTQFFYGKKRRDRYFRKWNRWVWENPFPPTHPR